MTNENALFGHLSNETARSGRATNVQKRGKIMVYTFPGHFEIIAL
jgi:hypothetical protein